MFHRNALEGFDKSDGELDSAVTGLHNLVHDFLSGTNSLSHSAANDPIFVVRNPNQSQFPWPGIKTQVSETLQSEHLITSVSPHWSRA